MFITFDGPRCAGKSTIISRLEMYLHKYRHISIPSVVSGIHTQDSLSKYKFIIVQHYIQRHFECSKLIKSVDDIDENLLRAVMHFSKKYSLPLGTNPHVNFYVDINFDNFVKRNKKRDGCDITDESKKFTEQFEISKKFAELLYKNNLYKWINGNLSKEEVFQQVYIHIEEYINV